MKMYQWSIGFIITLLLMGSALPTFAAEGLITRLSAYSVDTTMDRFEVAVKKRGLKIFARIDHAAAAKSVDLAMPPATVIVFGNPRLGTPNFIKTPTLAIDLPLKAIVWDDGKGQVFLSYNSAEYLYSTIYVRHGISYNKAAVAPLENALKAIADEALR
ncbi:MAG: DUF302 domain-containing protein [Nitrospirales bacterium]